MTEINLCKMNMIDLYASSSSIDEYKGKLALEISFFPTEEIELYETDVFQRYLHSSLSALESECEELGINIKDISFIESVLILTSLSLEKPIWTFILIKAGKNLISALVESYIFDQELFMLMFTLLHLTGNSEGKNYLLKKIKDRKDITTEEIFYIHLLLSASEQQLKIIYPNIKDILDREELLNIIAKNRGIKGKVSNFDDLCCTIKTGLTKEDEEIFAKYAEINDKVFHAYT